MFRLLYPAGVFKANYRNLEDFWRNAGKIIFSAAISAKRFMFLLTYLRFNIIENRTGKRKVDKLGPIRVVFEKFVNNCKTAYTPNEYVTLDKKLESTRGRCAFRQYIPNKSAK